MDDVHQEYYGESGDYYHTCNIYIDPYAVLEAEVVAVVVVVVEVVAEVNIYNNGNCRCCRSNNCCSFAIYIIYFSRFDRSLKNVILMLGSRVCCW